MAHVLREDNLISIARSYMMVYDHCGLERYLRRWDVNGLLPLLSGEDTDKAKIAALGLGLLGEPKAVAALTSALAHRDAVVSAMAEYALWTIWFGEYGSADEGRLRRAAQLPYAEAIELLEELIDQHPDWAEAYNQRAIVHFRQRCFISALDDCREVLAINDRHFGAVAGLGHTYAQLGLYDRAERCYRRALQLHPRLKGIRQALRTIRGLKPAIRS